MTDYHNRLTRGLRAMGYRHPVKRIRLTVEWVGRCSEGAWAGELVRVIEGCDVSDATRVIDVEELTQHGLTPRVSEVELRALGFHPRPVGPTFWEAFRSWLKRGN